MTILLNLGTGATFTFNNQDELNIWLDNELDTQLGNLFSANNMDDVDEDVPPEKKKYLGEEPVDLTTDRTYASYTARDWALHWLFRYGQIDGEHHKTWVMDQVAQILHGTPVVGKIARWDDGEIEYRFSLGEPSQAYRDWVEEYLGRDENGEAQYDYDTGIAP